MAHVSELQLKPVPLQRPFPIYGFDGLFPLMMGLLTHLGAQLRHRFEVPFEISDLWLEDTPAYSKDHDHFEQTHEAHGDRQNRPLQNPLNQAVYQLNSKKVAVLLAPKIPHQDP